MDPFEEYVDAKNMDNGKHKYNAFKVSLSNYPDIALNEYFAKHPNYELVSITNSGDGYLLVIMDEINGN